MLFSSISFSEFTLVWNAGLPCPTLRACLAGSAWGVYWQCCVLSPCINSPNKLFTPLQQSFSNYSPSHFHSENRKYLPTDGMLVWEAGLSQWRATVPWTVGAVLQHSTEFEIINVSCKPSNGCWKLNPGPLESTLKSSLQPVFCWEVYNI